MTDPEPPNSEPGEDAERLADELEWDAGSLEQRSEDLETEIRGTRGEWQAKRRDPSEAGAAPPPEGDEDTGPAPDDT